jgi:hypothetical protein
VKRPQPQDEAALEFEGFVPTDVKEIRAAAKKVYEAERVLEAEVEDWKERKKELEMAVRNSKSNLVILMKKHKHAAVKTGAHTAMLVTSYDVIVDKDVEGSDKLKPEKEKKESA